MYSIQAVTQKIPVEVGNPRRIDWVAGKPAGWWIIDEKAYRIAGYARRLTDALAYAHKLQKLT